MKYKECFHMVKTNLKNIQAGISAKIQTYLDKG